jgi:putative uncharacterized protein gbs1223
VLFLRPFNQIKEQIRTLHNRGIKIDTLSKYRYTKQYLLTNNYYNLVNGYGRFFWINTNLYQNTTFEELTHLYEFDTAIRNSLFSATLSAEKHLRGVIAYYISERCHILKKAEAYRDKSFYSKDILFVRKKIWETIDKNINSQNNNPIKNHHKKHGAVPFWVIVNYLSFNDLYKILENVPEIQDKVARGMKSFLKEKFSLTEPYTEKELLSFMYNIYELRNLCAHGNRLLDFKCKNNVVYYEPLHSLYNIQSTDPKQSIYHIFIVLQCFLSKMEYAILHNTIKKRMNNLENKLTSISHNKILNLLGFPNDWNRNVANLPQKNQ